jgi:hypothetical protein
MKKRNRRNRRVCLSTTIADHSSAAIAAAATLVGKKLGLELSGSRRGYDLLDQLRVWEKS